MTDATTSISRTVTEALRSLLAEMLDIAATDVGTDIPLTSFGIDSESVVELLTTVELLVGEELDVEIFLDGQSIADVAHEVESLIGEPADWPGPDFAGRSERTKRRQLLDDIVGGDDVPAAYIVRFGLPFGVPCRSRWSPGRFVGVFQPPQDSVVFRDMVFGGYVASVVDQFAGLASFTIMRDDTVLVTEKLEVGYKRPFRVANARVEARVVEAKPRQLAVEVEIRQDDVIVCHGDVTEVLIPRPTKA